MRGLRFESQTQRAYKVGAEPKERIAVEKIVALTRGIFEVAPVVTTLVVFVEAQQGFSDEIGDQLEKMGLVEEYLQQLQLDHEQWTTRLSHYAAWLSRAVDGATSYWLDETGNVLDEGHPDAVLEIEAADFLDLYVARPLLYGSAYTIPSAEFAKDKSGFGYAGVPDIGTGFSLVNQINAIGNIWDDAPLLEKRFGIWLEIGAQVKQAEWAQPYGEELQSLLDGASRALEGTSGFIEEVVKRAGDILIGLAIVAVIAWGFAKGRR